MDKIQLANCHVTQLTEKGVKSNWLVKNQKGDIIAELPTELTEKQVMKSIHFARKFELIAWNSGIEFGKEQYCERKKLLRVIKELTDANAVLADKLNSIK